MKKRLNVFIIVAIISVVCILLLTSIFISPIWANNLPQGFVYVKDIIPDIEIELRYYTEDNFIGERIDGYLKPRCILTIEAVETLKKVQEELKAFGLGLKIFDAYRPQRAVNHFIRWAKDLQDARMKSEYYPDVAKKDLFKEHYISKRSGHSRGSTVDLTIVSLNTEEKHQELDMGTGFDLFGPNSWPDDPSMNINQRAHRLLLQMLMKKHGFKSSRNEWWHFALEDEPYPDTYFDFPVE